MQSQTQSPCATVFALLMAIVLLGAFLFKGALTNAPSVESTKFETGFDATAAKARLARILGDERPHPVDSAANDAGRERLLAEIRALGFEPVVRDDFACGGSKRWGGGACARVMNVMFRMGPAGGNSVMVASHYDSVPAGPGAADDGIGVASALEIAARLKGKALSKPVIFLFTDGEEAGLLGAASFIRTDPWAKDVALAVNLEARGTGGPAIMFQTSARNGREIAALTHKPVRILANSMAADIYRTLPNDTDATEFLTKDMDVLNFAIISPLARYHTPLDSLTYLEPESLGQMGAAALSAVEGHMAATPLKGAESHYIYSDILGRYLLVLPQIAGYLLLGFGLFASGILFWVAGPKGGVRAFLAPLVSALVAGGVGFGALYGVGHLRPEEMWWTATPLAAQLTIYGAALVGIILALWLCRGVTRERTASAGWFWLSALFLGASVIAPGAMILLAPAAGIFALVAMLTFFTNKRWPWLGVGLSVIPAVLLMIMILPVLDFAEIGLGLEMGWAFGALAAMIGFVALAPLVSPDIGLGRIVAIFVATVAAGGIWASLAPAFAPDTPRWLDVAHVHSGPTSNWVISPGTQAPPVAMAKIAPFKLGAVAGLDTKRFVAPAPNANPAPTLPMVTVVNETIQGAKRVVTMRVTTLGADEVVISVPEEAKLTQFTSGSAPFDFDPAGKKGFRCVGRACTSWDMIVTIDAAKAPWTLRAIRRGVGPETQALVQARPNDTAPNQGGDVTVGVVDVRL